MISLINVYKSYTEAGLKKNILENANLTIPDNDPLIILGSSGSGKTTLLNVISGIDDIDAGELELFGINISAMTDDQKADYRKHNVGFVFQFYNLIPTLSVEENIFLPLELVKKLDKANKDRVHSLLEEVGLIDRLKSYPDTLSGGEQQRISLVRALANQPKLLIADEPTGNLDREGSDKIIKLMRRMCNESDVQLIMATHNQSLIEDSDSIVEINNKKLELRR